MNEHKSSRGFIGGMKTEHTEEKREGVKHREGEWCKKKRAEITKYTQQRQQKDEKKSCGME